MNKYFIFIPLGNLYGLLDHSIIEEMLKLKIFTKLINQFWKLLWNSQFNLHYVLTTTYLFIISLYSMTYKNIVEESLDLHEICMFVRWGCRITWKQETCSCEFLQTAESEFESLSLMPFCFNGNENFRRELYLLECN